MAAEPIGDGETLTVQIPLSLRKRGGRKLMVVPEGATAWAPRRACVDSAIVKAIARAHRWRRVLESGEYASVTELAAVEKINPSYLCRILRLTLLAPDIVAAILEGRQPEGIQLCTLPKRLPIDWLTQCSILGLIGHHTGVRRWIQSEIPSEKTRPLRGRSNWRE